MDPRTDPLERAHRHAADWFASLDKRPVPPSATADEVADRLGVPVGTVKSRSFRAHKRLAAMLGHLREAPT